MKRDLLLLHGALGNKRIFDKLVEDLDGQFNIHRIDFHGHGEAPMVNHSFSMHSFAKQVADYLDSKRIAQADIFGYSMGGYVGLLLCKLQPEKVGKLFTLGTKIMWSRDVAMAETGRLDPEKIQEKLPHYAMELQRRHQMDWKRMLAHTRELMLELGNHNILTNEVLANITHTVCIGVGDRDITVSIEEALVVKKLMSAGQLAVLPDTQHPFEKVPMELLTVLLRRFFG